MQQLLEVMTVLRIKARADARPNSHGLAGELDRQREGGADTPTYSLYRLGCADIRHEYRKFVTTHAADEVAVANAVAQPLRHHFERLVTSIVAYRVVNGLEAIEIDQQDSRHRFA